MITTPRPTRQVVPDPTREVVRRQVPLPATASPLAAIARPVPSLTRYDQLLDLKEANP